MAYSVTVSNISPSTTQSQLNDFFTFCGKITTIDLNSTTHTATIAFEKASSAKTALMLNGGTLDGSHLTVTSDAVHPDEPDHAPAGEHHDAPIEQSDKPRAGIVAEYLATGYKLTDDIVARAIDIDKKQGISTRFLAYMQSLDSAVGKRIPGPETTVSEKVQATLQQAHTRTRSIDQQHGISKQAHDYYAKAVGSPLGQKVYQFYTVAAKQVSDVHEEARRIADQRKTTEAAAAPAPAPAPASASTA